MPIARLEKVPLREVWRHEAHSFTRWLAENLDLLSDVTNIQLNLIQIEASAGPFSADILAEDAQGSPVIIENQLEQTDHDHLGKLITYMSNLDAKTAIWITSSPRPEHEKAVHWLNETLPADTSFFLVKVEAYRIGDSEPAPMMTIIAGPSQEGKQVGGQKKELAERHVMRLAFWEGLLSAAKKRTILFERIKPTKENWLTGSSGKTGFQYIFTVRMDDAQVEFYIDRGDSVVNKRIFDQLISNREEFETRFGSALDWQRLDERKACRVRYLISGHGLQDQDEWPKIHDQMVEAMVKMHKTFQPYVDAFKG